MSWLCWIAGMVIVGIAAAAGWAENAEGQDHGMLWLEPEPEDEEVDEDD